MSLRTFLFLVHWFAPCLLVAAVWLVGSLVLTVYTGNIAWVASSVAINLVGFAVAVIAISQREIA